MRPSRPSADEIVACGGSFGRMSSSLAPATALASAVLTAFLAAAPAAADPEIVSSPRLFVNEGEPYSYIVVVRDDDDDDDDDDDGDDDKGNSRISVDSKLPRWLTFDGVATISGTPGTQDAGRYRISIEARQGNDRDRQEFTITVLDVAAPPPPQPPPQTVPPPSQSQPADLEAAITVAPDPALAGGSPAMWTLTVRNVGEAYVANIGLRALFSGDVPLEFAPVASALCTLQPRGNEIDLDCRIGPLAVGQSQSIQVLGSSSEAGEIVGVVTASITDAVPVDGALANNVARASLSVAARLSSGPAQQLDAPRATALTTGDFNGDGLDDLAVATGLGERTLVFLNGIDANNRHKRSFATAPIYAGQPAPGNDIAAADLDGDGHVDLVVANAGAANHALFNDGSGRFAVTALGGGGGTSNGVALGDVNGDGLADVVLANEGANTIYLNQGGRMFALDASLGQANSVDVLIVDLLGDALPELVFANRNADADVYQSTGGGFVRVATLPTGPTTAVSAADFDGDGVADVVFGRSAAVIGAANLVFLNRSMTSPAFLMAGELGGSATVDVVADDVDLDGRDDVVTINAVGSHQLYKNSVTAGSTVFVLHQEQFGSGGAVASAAGKFNPDDRVDIAVGGANRVSVYLNDGRGNFGVGDIDPPTLTLLGTPTVKFPVGFVYEEKGATAMDAIDGDLTAAIVIENPVNAAVIGTYVVRYNVVDRSGNAARAVERAVEVTASGGSGGGGGGAVGGELLLLLLAAASLSRLGRARHAVRARARRAPAAIRHASDVPGLYRQSLRHAADADQSQTPPLDQRVDCSRP
jgi:Domain of unknown function (DUF5011)/FG-GAP-like repeat/Putative Ig domain/FG-GAP repeat